MHGDDGGGGAFGGRHAHHCNHTVRPSVHSRPHLSTNHASSNLLPIKPPRRPLFLPLPFSWPVLLHKIGLAQDLYAVVAGLNKIRFYPNCSINQFANHIGVGSIPPFGTLSRALVDRRLQLAPSCLCSSLTGDKIEGERGREAIIAISSIIIPLPPPPRRDHIKVAKVRFQARESASGRTGHSHSISSLEGCFGSCVRSRWSSL